LQYSGRGVVNKLLVSSKLDAVPVCSRSDLPLTRLGIIFLKNDAANEIHSLSLSLSLSLSVCLRAAADELLGAAPDGRAKTSLQTENKTNCTASPALKRENGLELRHKPE